MFNLLAIGWEHYAFTIPLSLLSVFLMLVILVQRGRGGGLTGALGGMGGQSAFGTKAGDLFTRITVGVAAVWILLSMAALKILNQTGTAKAGTPPAATAPGPDGTKATPPATKTAPPTTTTPAEKAPATTPAAPAKAKTETSGSDKSNADTNDAAKGGSTSPAPE